MGLWNFHNNVSHNKKKQNKLNKKINCVDRIYVDKNKFFQKPIAKKLVIKYKNKFWNV